jgi:hypothetical protein
MYDPHLTQFLTQVHLHGHSFQVLYRSDSDAGHFDPDNVPKLPANPVRRDVILVKSNGFAILAFRADNPGTWFLYVSCTGILIIVIVILIGMSSRGWSLSLLKPLLRCRRGWLFLTRSGGSVRPWGSLSLGRMYND